MQPPPLKHGEWSAAVIVHNWLIGVSLACCYTNTPINLSHLAFYFVIHSKYPRRGRAHALTLSKSLAKEDWTAEVLLLWFL